MVKHVVRRLEGLEATIRGLKREGCPHCRNWGHSVIQINDGPESPPPVCPDCGRARPVTLLHRTYAVTVPNVDPRADEMLEGPYA